MRWFLGTIAALIVAVAIYLGLAASSLATLASAARAGDIAKVLEKTDVKAVTRSLTNQIVNAYLDRIGATRKVGAMEKMLINTYGATIADAMAAKMLTADNLTQILKSGKVDASQGLPAFAGLPALGDLHTGNWLSLLGRVNFIQPKNPTRKATPRSICTFRGPSGSFPASNCRSRSLARWPRVCQLNSCGPRMTRDSTGLNP